jgi:hypothetical protein
MNVSKSKYIVVHIEMMMYSVGKSWQTLVFQLLWFWSVISSSSSSSFFLIDVAGLNDAISGSFYV